MAFFLFAVYTSPAAFCDNLVKCMQQDWQLNVESLLSLFPALKLAGIGMEVSVDFVKDELKKDAKSALQTIMDAYLTLVTEAHKVHKAGVPRPVIIIDEVNLLMEWKDEAALKSLLAFLVYLAKEAKLAHVILATSDTFLTEKLELGAPSLQLRCFLVLIAPLRAQDLLNASSAPHLWLVT